MESCRSHHITLNIENASWDFLSSLGLSGDHYNLHGGVSQRNMPLASLYYLLPQIRERRQEGNNGEGRLGNLTLNYLICTFITTFCNLDLALLNLDLGYLDLDNPKKNYIQTQRRNLNLSLLNLHLELAQTHDY